MADLRAARAADAGALAGLAGQLGYPTEADAMAARLDRLLGDAGHRVTVALAGGGVVGWAHSLHIERLESGPAAELAGLVVDAGHRGRGLGRALVEDAAAWAAADGLALTVRTNTVREATHRFYEALGFVRAKSQHVYRRGPAS